MSDFYQTGVVTTLHRLKPDNTEGLETELERFSGDRPIGLLLPALVSEFEKPAMHRIIDQLRNVSYLSRIVIALGQASHDQYLRVTEQFRGFRATVDVVWVDSPRILELFQLLDEKGLSAGPDGKGRSCWITYGYLMACRDVSVIALHDCDIVDYDRSLLARLVYPVAHPALPFEFCKGYYARVTDRMHGRVTRLFVTPFVRALATLAPNAPFLTFLDSFRYPLAGEFAMDIGLARVNRIPANWGLEVGVLAEVFRNCAIPRICQVDLADNYEHKHQDLSAGDSSRGLSRMALEIARSIFGTLASEGVALSAEHLHVLQVRYVRMAQDTIARYYADAMINGLQFDRHAEEQAVDVFAQSLRLAADDFSREPLGLPLIPNWNRVLSAIPDFFDRLADAVTSEPRAVAAS